MPIPRMRTAAGVLEEIKREDPDTMITLRYVRRIIHNGWVPVAEVGVKKLVNLDTILEYIASGVSPMQTEEGGCGVIRRVQV